VSDHDVTLLEDAKKKHEESTTRLEEIRSRITGAAENPDAVDADELAFLRASFDAEEKRNQLWADAVTRTEVTLTARAAMKPQKADEPNQPAQRVEVKEPLTYRSPKEGGQHSFFHDLRASNLGDDAARDRLNRHASEMRVEKRDLTSTAGAGGEFIPPMWLMDRWIPLLRSSRAIADSLTQLDLPSGAMSISLPKLSGGTATAIQASENAAIQETDATTTSVTANVRTIAGMQDLSTQLFEIPQPGLDEILFRDLARDYATKLDVQVISGSGSSGQLLGLRTVSGINTVAYTDASPTAGEAYPKLASAISSVTSAYMTADTIAMHPRRWAWFLSAVDTAGRPLFSPNAGNAQNAMGTGSNTTSNGEAGNIMGLRVIVDPNLPTNIGAGTNEDVVLVYDSSQIFLWEEGAPRTRVFEDIGSGTLTVRLRVHGYVALMANRLPTAISVISGTGLVAPTF
jgi:HK97 family phage major capsid protein